MNDGGSHRHLTCMHQAVRTCLWACGVLLASVGALDARQAALHAKCKCATSVVLCKCMCCPVEMYVRPRSLSHLS